MADYLGMGEETSFPTQYLHQQQGMAELANKRANTQHQLATADYLGAMGREANVRAANAELELDVNKKVADLQQIAATAGDQTTQNDPVKQLNMLAGIYAKNGLITKAEAAWKMGSLINSQQATAAARETTADARNLSAQSRMLDKIKTQLGNVTDSAGWEAVKNSIISADPNVQDFVDRLGEYSPEKASALQAAMTSYKDKAWAANAQKRTEIYDRIKSQSASQADTRIGISQERLAMERQREARLAKEGGDRATARERKAGAGKPDKAPTAAGMPTKAEVAVVEGELKKLGISADAGDHQEIAQEARIRWRANPGVTQSQATSQIIQERMDHGDITPPTVEKKPVAFGLGSRDVNVPAKITFSRNRPAALPANLKDAVKGQYYNTSKGLHQYMGDDNFREVK